MSILNWLALVLSLVLWTIQLQIGHGIAMASSTTKEGSPEDRYLDKMEKVRLIVFLGAVLTFISQLIPIPLVKTVGLIILAFSLVFVAMLRSGLLRIR